MALTEDEALELSDTGSAWMPLGPMRGETSRPAAEAAPLAKPALPDDLQGYLDDKERQILVRALRETGFNRTLAAKQLGLTLRQIRYRIARLKIDAPDMQGEDGDD